MTERRKFRPEQFQEGERQFQLVVQACGQAVDILETNDKERLVTLLLWQPPFDLLRSTLDSFTAGIATGQCRILEINHIEGRVKPVKLNQMKQVWNQVLFHFRFSSTFLRGSPKYAQLIKELEASQEGESICCLYDFAQVMKEFAASQEVGEKVIQRVGLDQSAEIITTSKIPLITAFGKITEYLQEIAGNFGFSLEPPTKHTPRQ